MAPMSGIDMKPFSVLFLAALAVAACNRTLPPEEDRIQLERNSEFDGQRLRFFVALEDGTKASVSTEEDLIEVLPGRTPMPGHRAQAYTFLKVDGDDTSLSHALLSWDPDNPSDNLVFGWWAQFRDQHPPELSLSNADRWAIVDGPELDHGVVPLLPVDGTAGYEGQAGGLYSYSFGSDWGDNQGDFVIEEYQGTVTLTADFADGTLKGCIGCVGDLVTQRAHFGVILGQGLIDGQGLARDYELHLPSAIFREDGMFERGRVNLRHPERTVTLSEGFWGGALSSRQDAAGTPGWSRGSTASPSRRATAARASSSGRFWV